MKTTWINAIGKEKWVSINADGLVLGRLASRIAMMLTGKNRVTYTPNYPSGDFVVVTNTDKLLVTGKKPIQKLYRHHSGYRCGGLKEIKCKDMLKDNSDRMLMLAVKRMLPKNKLQKVFLKRLKLFKGAEHSHQAQGPVEAKLQREG